MDVEEVRRILFTRVQSVDSENAFKIMGYLLLQDWAEQDLFRVGLGSEAMLLSLISKAKKELGLPNKSVIRPPQPHQTLQSSSSASQGHSSAPSTASQVVDDFLSTSHHHPQEQLSNDSFFMGPLDMSFGALNRHNGFFSESNDQQQQQQWPTPPLMFPRPPSLYDKFGVYQEDPRHCHPYFNLKKPDHHYFLMQQQQSRWGSTSPPLIDGSSPYLFPVSNKPCLFYTRGYCKHGNSCRFAHTNGISDCDKPHNHMNGDGDSSGSDDGFLSHTSFDTLEQELRELLRGRKTPVSIASLPQMYYERFGKSLQAEGYLTESQRHGKAGFSLTKLLMRLEGTLTLIQRPHGQHAVMLMEDSLQFSDKLGYRDDHTAMNSSSRQIYLTFPAESTFTEDDVTIHFRAYGPVQDVRIPYQQKRMFGFVTFVYAETVRTILTEGNPHYICGARVLVKPYKEKGKVSSDRKSHDKDQNLKQTPVVNNPMPRSFKEEQHLSNGVEDSKVSTMEQRFAELQLAGSVKSDSSPETNPKLSNNVSQLQDSFCINVDDSTNCPDDGFSLHSSNFRYVLDLLEGESKDSDTFSDSARATISKMDAKPLDLHFSTTGITDPIANPMQKLKSHQNTHPSPYSWGATTLFARSVF